MNESSLASSGWAEVWANRVGSTETLQDLIEMDGFDEGASRVKEKDWLEFVRGVLGEVRDACGGFQPGESILELGCGAGAFLEGLMRASEVPFSFTGLDYSESLLAIATRRWPHISFINADLRRLPDFPSADHVFAHAVIHYLDPKEFSITFPKVLRRARRTVTILDIPDPDLLPMAEKVRISLYPDGAYSSRYAELRHSAYSRDFFSPFLGDDWTVKEIKGFIRNYRQAEFRYGLIFLRRQ